MNRDRILTKFAKSDIYDAECMSITDFNYIDDNDCFTISKGNLEPYILPEDVKLKYNRDNKDYNIEFTMQAGTLKLDNGMYISIFRAVTEDGANDLNFPPYVYRRISVLGMKVETTKSNKNYIFTFPVLYPVREPNKYGMEDIFREREQAGVEDPRVMVIGNRVILTYSAYNGQIASVGFASMDVSVFKDKIEKSINLIDDDKSTEAEKLWSPSAWIRHGYLDCGFYVDSDGNEQEMDDRDTCIVDKPVELWDGRVAYPIIHRAAPGGLGIKKTLKLGFLSADENGELSLTTINNRIQLLKDLDSGKIIEKDIIEPSKSPDEWLFSGLGLNGAPIPLNINGETYYLLSIHSGRVADDVNDPEVVHDYKVGFIICDKFFNTVFMQKHPTFSPELTSELHENRKKWWVKWVRISAGHFVLENRLTSDDNIEIILKVLVTMNDTEIRSCLCNIKINSDEIKKLVRAM